MSTEDVTAEIAAVLAEHYPLTDYDGQIDECGCGQQIGGIVTDDRKDYAAHLADALADLLAARDRRVRAEAEQQGREDNADHAQCYVHGSKALEARLADAWDEGYRAADSDGLDRIDPTRNPYREADA